MGDNKESVTKDSLLVGSMTSTKLRGPNYLQWSRAVKVALKARGKSSFISDIKPSDITKIPLWEQEDAQIMTLLWNSLEPDVFQNVSCAESAKEIWDNLQEMYSSDQNISRIYQLYEDIFSFEQGDRSVDDYFSILKGMWDELNVYQPLTTDLKKQQQHREEFWVAKFLSGLKKELVPVSSQILSGKEISTVSEAFAYVRRAAVPLSSPVTDCSC